MIQDPTYWLLIIAAVMLYWSLPLHYRGWFLGITSFGFILTLDAWSAILMLAISLLIQALFAPLSRRAPMRYATLLAILITTACLAYFKYLPAIGAALSDNYSFSKIILPLGISYFAFKMIHYAVERDRNALPRHGFGDFLTYIFLPPIFTAGPIQRFDLFINQRSDCWNADHAWVGLTRIAQGLIKKFVIATALLMAIERVSLGGVMPFLDRLDSVSPFQIVLYLILTYLFVYMDFSGYTDIAIGTSRLFGLRIMENFNLPILAPNIGNLWKRWHMSLASWCQSYIYMPMLGVSRSPYIAVFTSFLIMGLWHAASMNWVAWGLYNAAGVAIFQKWSSTARRQKWRIVRSAIYKGAAYPLTFLFFAGSFAFTMTDGRGGLWGAVRLLAKCFGIDLPA